VTNKPRNEDEENGRLAGFGAGAVTGAQLGTMLIPIPFVGTFTGALVGGALGSRLGQKLGPTVLGALPSLGSTSTAQAAAPRATSVPISSEASEASSNPDLLSQLERLGQLHTQGVLTDEEFAATKGRLLNR